MNYPQQPLYNNFSPQIPNLPIIPNNFQNNEQPHDPLYNNYNQIPNNIDPNQIVAAGLPQNKLLGNSIPDPGCIRTSIHAKMYPTKRESENLYCQVCKKVVISRVRYKITSGTIIAGILCLCIPLCLTECQMAQHFCSSCNRLIGNLKN